MHRRNLPALVLGLILGTGVLYGFWTAPTLKFNEGQSFAAVRFEGTLTTSVRYLDLTSSNTDLLSALTVMNDSAVNINIQEGLSSGAMTAPSSGTVLPGEKAPLPIRCRYLALKAASGTAAVRVWAGK